MIPFEHVDYVCALRWKKGEYEALGQLDDPVKDRLGPHVILPPPSAKDLEKGRALQRDEFTYEQVGRLSRLWGSRPSLVDFRSTKLSDNRKEDGRLIASFLDVAARYGCSAIPVVDLRTNEERLQAITDHWLSTGCGIAIRVTFANLDDPALSSKLSRLLLRLVARPDQCLLVVDLAQADVSNAAAFSVFVSNWILRFQSMGLWRRIIVESSNYPRVNPAPDGGQEVVPRNEWLSWKQVLPTLDTQIRDIVLFGDFGADHGEIDFSPGGRTITHLRYATPDKWLIVRGDAVIGADDGRIHSVARRIRGSGHFAGEGFSAGDEFIADCAAELVVGNATDWRRANMNHHMTRATVDITSFMERPIPLRSRRRKPVQQELLLKFD